MLSNSISTLFSGMSSNNGTSSIYSSLSELASIRTGSYRKLAQKYYSDNKSSVTDSIYNDRTTSTSKDSTAVLAAVKSSADELKSSADILTGKGSSSVFSQKDGEYDTDRIYDAVKNYVDKYNSVIDSASKSGSDSISSSVNRMVRATTVNSKLLAKIGITAGSDNRLTLNEDVFKKADMTNVKSLFNGNGSYGYQTSVNASMLSNTVKNESAKSNTYNNNGYYSYNYTSGDLFNQIV